MSTDTLMNQSQNLASSDDSDALKHEFLSFTLDKETFAIEILCVQEIIGYTSITKVPNSPDYVRGVINLRGAVIPIFDLRKRFHMDEVKYTKYTVIIVVELNGKTIGMIVDAVADVLSIKESDIQNMPEFSRRIQTDFLKGMAKADNKLVILLDIQKILSFDELAGIETISQIMDVKENTDSNEEGRDEIERDEKEKEAVPEQEESKESEKKEKKSSKKEA